MNTFTKSFEDFWKLLTETSFYGVSLSWIILGVIIILILWAIIANALKDKSYKLENLVKAFYPKYDKMFNFSEDVDPMKVLIAINRFIDLKDDVPLSISLREYSNEELKIWQNFISSLPLKKGRGKLLVYFNTK